MSTKMLDEALYGDLLFKEALTHHDNRKVLIDFLATMTDFSKEYLESVKLDVAYESPLNKTKPKDKSFKSDIVIKFDNYMINLESYSYFDELSLAKSLSYVFRIYSTSVDRGNSYKKQESITQVNIVDNVKANISSQLLSTYAIINTEDLSDRLLSDKITIKIYRLDKSEDKPYNVSEKELQWVKFIKAKNYRDRQKIAKGSEILMEFNNWLEDYLNDEETVKLYSEWNDVINRNTGYFFGEKAGIEKGRQDGIKDNKIATAKEMLKADVPIDDIMKFTKLSKKEILSLMEE